MKYTPLHINTEYSFHESSIKIDKLIEKAKSLQIDSLAITDHNVMFGVAEFVNKCKKVGIKPIIGLELDVEDFRVVLLAKNFDGYKKLNVLSSRKMKGGEISISDIESNDLFIIDHPTLGHYAKTKTQLPHENYFVGTSNETFGNTVYMKVGKALESEDVETVELISKMNDMNLEEKFEPLDFNPDVNSTSVQQAIQIAKLCNVEFPTKVNILPKYENETGESSNKYLKSLINEAAKRMLSGKPNKDVYVERIKYEVSIIEKLGFEDYFLIIWDLIKWSKENGIVIGPGRGSAAGSLISYLLDITEIDPIEYGLLFERFLNPERATMPDIDIDIQDTRRDETIKYLFDKYGEENVALISTFSRLGAKSAIRDVARFKGIAPRDINVLSKLIPSDVTLEQALKESSRFRALIQSSSVYEEIYKLSIKIEGLPRQYSTHAAGIVISDAPINTKAPTLNGLDGYNQVQFSMDHLEENGFLKIDLLGLRNLTIIKRIQDEIFDNHKKRIDLLKLPKVDAKTNELLSAGDTNGIFQLESYGMRRTLEDVGVSSINDVVAILSLYRPGPMDNIPLFAQNKSGKKKIESVSPEFDEITKETYGIIVYQEQIMQIAQRFSGMSFGQADILRRAIGKKKASLIDSLKAKFISGAIEKGHPEAQAIRIYELIEKFADYGFNKSHAVAYSMLSWRMAFLKARFAFEFYTALLDSSISSQATVGKYVSEAKAKNITVIAPDINRSQLKVVNNNKEIILPLQIIKGFGDAAAKKVIQEREKGPFKDFNNFVARIKLAGIGESTITLLIESNSLRSFANSRTLIDSLPSALRYANMVTVSQDGEKVIDETIISKPKLIAQERDMSNEIFNEKRLFGFQLNAFKTSAYETENKLVNVSDSPIEVTLLVERIRVYKTKSGDEFGRISVSDSSMSTEMVVFGKLFEYIRNTKSGTIVKAVLEFNKNAKTKYVLKQAWKEVKNG